MASMHCKAAIPVSSSSSLAPMYLIQKRGKANKKGGSIYERFSENCADKAEKNREDGKIGESVWKIKPQNFSFIHRKRGIYSPFGQPREQLTHHRPMRRKRRGGSPVAKEMEGQGAKMDEIKQLGRKKFAYNARQVEGGHYVNYIFEAAPEAIVKIQSALALNTSIYMQHYQRIS